MRLRSKLLALMIMVTDCHEAEEEEGAVEEEALKEEGEAPDLGPGHLRLLLEENIMGRTTRIAPTTATTAAYNPPIYLQAS